MSLVFIRKCRRCADIKLINIRKVDVRQYVCVSNSMYNQNQKRLFDGTDFVWEGMTKG